MRAFPWMLMAVIAASAASVDATADDNSDESKAVAKIELLGGKVTRDDTVPESPVVGADFRDSKRFNDQYIHLLKSCTSLKSLNLSGTQITDVGLKGVGELTQLTYQLDLAVTQDNR